MSATSCGVDWWYSHIFVSSKWGSFVLVAGVYKCCEFSSIHVLRTLIGKNISVVNAYMCALSVRLDCYETI